MAAAWLLVALVWAVQSTVGASLQGRTQPFAAAIGPALVQSLAWVPVTLAIIYLAARFPLERHSWQRRLPIHIAGAIAVTFIANVLVVLGFWLINGRFDGVMPLLRNGALWTAIRLHIGLLIYAAIAGLTHVVLHYRAARRREVQLARVEGQLARARLQALNAQIRPHFLFNTLHTIGQLWRSGNREDAEIILDRLGSLFHKVQHSTNQTEVPLADELELVNDYLVIEQMRFRDRLRVHIAAPDETRELLVPPLILQPLVENAVRHGISRTSTSGRIEVNASLRNGDLLLTVLDDGPGFHDPSEQRGSGTGLRNTSERLAELYGGRAHLRIERENDATVVRIVLPAHEE